MVGGRRRADQRDAVEWAAVSARSIACKGPALLVAFLVGLLASSQAGWTGAELVVNAPLMGPVENFIAGLIFSAAAAVSFGGILLIRQIANPLQWIVVPVFLYVALVPGAWNGAASARIGAKPPQLRMHRTARALKNW